jgi:hypothetical protein
LGFAEAKGAILASRSKIWKDPESIREASIGQPFTCINTVVLTCVCIEANARNSFGGYTGLQKSVVEIGPPPRPASREMTFGDKCDGLEPFPELNGGFQAAAPGAPVRRPLS